jgi:hypothetical protein
MELAAFRDQDDAGIQPLDHGLRIRELTGEQVPILIGISRADATVKRCASRCPEVPLTDGRVRRYREPVAASASDQVETDEEAPRPQPAGNRASDQLPMAAGVLKLVIAIDVKQLVAATVLEAGLLQNRLHLAEELRRHPGQPGPALDALLCPV